MKEPNEHDNKQDSGSPVPDKKKATLRIFHSVKEQEDEMIAYWASITPLQRLAHLYQLVTMTYGSYTGPSRLKGCRIRIIKPE